MSKPQRKLLGKQLGGTKAFAVNPDPAAAGSALCAHFSRDREICGLNPFPTLGVPVPLLEINSSGLQAWVRKEMKIAL